MPSECLISVFAFLLVLAAPALAQEPVDWRYTLTSESQLVDDCLICGRPAIVAPLRGTFDLRSVEATPISTRYAVTNVNLTAATSSHVYKIKGNGWYEVRGHLAVVQTMALELDVHNGVTNRLCSFTNSNFVPDRLWPMLHLSLPETNGTLLQVFQLELFAAPLRELWFSTTQTLTPANPKTAEPITGGDLLSADARIVKRNRDLTARLGVMPVVPDLGLDGLDILPEGEVIFSIEKDVFSETLGPLRHGDMLSTQGRVATSYAKLSGAFGPEPPPADQGLDAIQMLPTETVFSVEQDFFSETLGLTIRAGDLLSSRGVVLKKNEDLLAQFKPVDPKQDYGLDAIHLWPNGEIWFSVEKSFVGSGAQTFGAGDLLSDQGYVVFRNLDLVNAFQPVEDLADFGLDALFLLSDAILPASCRVPPELTSTSSTPNGADMLFTSKTSGRLFQLEKASSPAGPWLPFGPITTEPPAIDPGALTNATSAFYRLRQW